MPQETAPTQREQQIALEKHQDALRRTQAALDHAQARYLDFYELAPVGYLTISQNALILQANLISAALLGCPRDRLIGKLLPAFLQPTDADRYDLLCQRVLASGNMQSSEFRLRKNDGQAIWVKLQAIAATGDDGAAVIRLVLSDITARHCQEQAAKQASEDTFKLVADNAFDGIVIIDAQRRVEYLSPAYARQLGYSDAEELKHSAEAIFTLVHPQDRELLLARIHRALEAKETDLLHSYRIKHRLGHYFWHESSAKLHYDGSGQLVRACIIARDISQRKAAEAQIRQLAYFDQLTGLPNRALLLDRLQQVLAASTTTGHCASLLYVDMDNFKTLKHTLGHDIGNRILQLAAQRLTACVDAGDTVARIGGDEFMVLLVGLGHDPVEAAKKTQAVAGNILAALRQPYPLDTLSHHCSAGIGATLYPGQGVSADDLLKQVDLAMYHAKSVGHQVLRFFDPKMERGVKQRIALEKDLRHAVAAGQFVLHYQAQVQGADLMTGAEVLLRWQHPQQGMVSPADFIALAEKTGLILALGHWVLETACAQLTAWADVPELAQLTLAVNVSALQFAQTDFVEQVLTVVQRSGANPWRLKLELTESLLVGNVSDIIGKMNLLKARGIGFSLDDFGTGFSSLAYLSRLPLDQLKIDRSFVCHALLNADNAAIARSIIALAHSLNLDVIAEGVETEAQRAFLADSGCHAYQGYLFSRPLPLAAFEALARCFAVDQDQPI